MRKALELDSDIGADFVRCESEKEQLCAVGEEIRFAKPVVILPKN